MSVNLRRFQPNEIYISKHEAWTILKFFWPHVSLTEQELTQDDINFAQALLLEAIDASYKMGYAHIMFDVFYGKVPGSFADVGKMVKAFAKKAAKHWFRHLGGKDVSKAEIYTAVRSTVALNFRSVMEIRQQTGELTY